MILCVAKKRESLDFDLLFLLTLQFLVNKCECFIEQRLKTKKKKKKKKKRGR